MARRDKQAKLLVRITYEYSKEELDEYDLASGPEEYFFINIANPSDRKIKVEGIILLTKNQKINLPISDDAIPFLDKIPKIPFCLPPYDSVSLVAYRSDFAGWLSHVKISGKAKIKLGIIDSLGKVYKSNRLSVNTSD